MERFRRCCNGKNSALVNGQPVPDTPYYYDTYKVIELDDH